MGKMLGLKISLMGGQWIAVALPEEEVNQFVQDWVSGAMQLKGQKRQGGRMTDGFMWAVDTSQIAALHTFDAAAITGCGYHNQVNSGQPTQQPPGPGFIRR